MNFHHNTNRLRSERDTQCTFSANRRIRRIGDDELQPFQHVDTNVLRRNFNFSTPTRNHSLDTTSTSPHDVVVCANLRSNRAIRTRTNEILDELDERLENLLDRVIKRESKV
ncbi:predicted protein [Chaetoceros tenuissimus]|uniref:Uncharacterized protein n=1 Tax=Chaetoceros tenuissimus TaxID=426638 RepID=A0AAD3HA83_9STRA|nr:predicted protein [Chaetoceros tenuissimus]